MSSQGAPSGGENNGSKSSNEKSDDNKEQKQRASPPRYAYFKLEDYAKGDNHDMKEITKFSKMISKVVPGQRGDVPRGNSNGPSTSGSKN